MLGGVDINDDAVESYAKNIGAPGYKEDIVKFYEDDDILEEFLSKIGFDRGSTSVVIGCAPCQGFSAHRKKHKGPDDHRNSLVGIFASIAAQMNPDCILIENVPELLSEKYAVYFQEAKSTLETNKYKVSHTIVNAAEFGVPQARYRALIVAMKKGSTIPEALLSSAEFRTVRDAIGHLCPVSPGEIPQNDQLHRCANHRKNTIDTISQVPHDGGSRPEGVGPKCLDSVSGFYDVYGRLSWDKPSITITHYARNPASGRFVHPEQNRGLTLREMACLQSFPNTFDFHGSFDSVAKQIGEAVPPILSAAIAGSIFWDLQNEG
jgi:DNA (cytosine-5)-methyltransferase 1